MLGFLVPTAALHGEARLSTQVEIDTTKARSTLPKMLQYHKIAAVVRSYVTESWLRSHY